MNADIFAEWMRRQGHTVRRTASSYWYNQGPRTFQAFPYHWTIEPTEAELAQFMRSEGVVALRYSTPLAAPRGHVSYHACCDDKGYGLDTLGRWARKNVRHGLRHCSVEPITFERLATEGWVLQVDTLDRQGREVRFTQAMWTRLCRAASDLPGFEAWGALVGGALAATVITFQMGDCGYMLYQQCHRDHLPHHVNNALSFVVTQTVMQREAISSILYGLHSLDAPSSVDEFKFRMGYRAVPVRQRVLFHPWARPFVGRRAHALLCRVMAWRPNNAVLTKAEGMIRFYLEGQRPLAAQQWPAGLAAQAGREAVH